MPELIAVEQPVLAPGQIKKLIDDFEISPDRASMIKGAMYYENQNDVLKLDFRKYKGLCKTGEKDSNGNPILTFGVKINENRSNYRIPHNFFKLLVDQLVNYITGKGVTYTHPDETFIKWLDKKLVYDFDETVSMWLEESRIKGKSYLHFYYGTDGMLNYAVIPAEQVVPIYKDDFKKELDQVIRYYMVPAVNAKGETIEVTQAEWWTDKAVTVYRKEESGDFAFVEQMSHWTFNMDTSPDYVEAHSWGVVPFIELRTGIRGKNDLQDVKGQIDTYDLLMSEFVNQIADVREILVKVLGYSGSSADEILQAFKGTGIVKIDDASGNVDVLKTEIPVEARTTALKTLKDNIFMIGKGVDTNPEKYGTAIAGVALQMMYRPLDMKSDTAIIGLNRALGKFMWFLADDYNRNHGGAIDYMDIKISYNKNTVEDVAAIIESNVKLKGIASDETIWERIPGIDPSTESERMENQEAKQLDEFNAAMQE